MSHRAAILLAGLLVATVVACGDASMKRVEDPFSGGYPLYRDATSGFDVIFGTPDLGLGPQRVAFAVLGPEGIVSAPSLDLTLRGGGGAQALTARYHPFPTGTRGLYVTEARFANAGSYVAEVIVPSNGESVRLRFPFDVRTEPESVAVGKSAPASRNRVGSEVASLAELTTSTTPEPSLYRVRIADAIASGRPFVVVFASPAFCTTPLCGPQVEDLAVLARDYAGKAEFIHVDLYENPHEIRGDLARARRTPILKEWGVTTDEWTFVVASDGRIAARFEAYAAREEVEGALQAVLAR